MKFAVAFAATLGAVVLMSQTAEARPEMVGIHADNYEPGTIVVKTNERRLYLILVSGHAMRYPVGVGKSGKQWAGTTRIDAEKRDLPTRAEATSGWRAPSPPLNQAGPSPQAVVQRASMPRT